jgi:hypothetical protein
MNERRADDLPQLKHQYNLLRICVDEIGIFMKMNDLTNKDSEKVNCMSYQN